MGELMKGSTYSQTVNGWKQCWSVEDLWEAAKEYPVELIPVVDLVDKLNGTCWTEGAGEDATPQWVLGHTRRILKADLNCPILIDEKNNILDGVHRLCKAVLDGRDNIAVQRIERLPEPLFEGEEGVIPLFI